MPRQSIQLIDGDRTVVATADVECREGCYTGPANLDRMPEPHRRMFEEYERIVNDQMFGLLDLIEDRIAAIPFLVALGDGRETPAQDLQVFPEFGTISFRLVEPAMLEGRR